MKDKTKKKAKKPFIYHVLTVLMIVSALALILFASAWVVPGIQAKRTRARIPKPDLDSLSASRKAVETVDDKEGADEDAADTAEPANGDTDTEGEPKEAPETGEQGAGEGAEKPDEGSDEPGEAAEKPEEAAEKPNEGSDEPDEAADEPDEGADKAEEGADEPNEGADKPNEGADKPNEGADEPEEGADKPEESAEKPEEGSDEPDEGTDEPKEDADEPEEGTDEPDEGTDEPEGGTDEPKEGADEPAESTDEPEEGSDEPEEGADEPDESAEQPEEGTDEPGEGSDEQPDEDGEAPKEYLVDANGDLWDPARGYLDEEGNFVRFSEEDEAEISEAFMELYEMNPDIVGWLEAGEIIDYPVLRGNDEFYLHHDFFKNYQFSGSIFMTQYNVMRPRDTIFLIYGHNMNSGVMFGKLKLFMERQYMCEHALVRFQTIFADEEGDCWYVPIAMFSASMNDDAAGFFDIRPVYFEDLAAHQAYLDEILARSAWEAPTDVTTDDELIVMITCSYNLKNSRYLLYCRKLRPDETPEQMKELYLSEYPELMEEAAGEDD